jgi:multidrug resistance efflux pump
MKTRLTLWIVLLCAATVLLSGCASTAQAAPTAAAPTAQSVDLSVAEGRLVPFQALDLAFESGGRVAETNGEEGQVVKAGQVLARLEGSEIFQAQEAAAKLEIVQAEQALQRLKDDTLVSLAATAVEMESAHKEYDEAASGWSAKDQKYPSTFETALSDYVEAERMVREAQQKLDEETDHPGDTPLRTQAQNRLEREKTRRATAYQTVLTKYEGPREGEALSARSRLVNAIARMEAARLRQAKLNGGPDPDSSAVLQARLKSAQAAQAAAQKNLRALELRAPWNGTLVNWDLKTGQFAGPGQVVGALADTTTWWIETTDLAENDVIAFKIGGAVNVTVNALAGQTFTGTVKAIHGKGEKVQGDMTYQARIALNQSDPRFYWNMTVKVTVKDAK